MENNKPIIKVEGLAAGYGRTVILENINFEIHAGEIFVLLGGSGSGKSTVLRHMIGLQPPLAGNVFFHGRNFTRAGRTERSDILRSIGVSFQSSALFGSMTLLENVRLPLEEHTDLPSELIDRIASVKLAQVGLSGYEYHLPAELSGGMQKRAAVARAMAMDPTILMLDEPSAGLDPITSAGLDRLILDLSKTLGITVLVVTHELESVFTIADRVVMLDKTSRGIIAEGSPQQLRDDRSNEAVWRFFNRLPQD